MHNKGNHKNNCPSRPLTSDETCIGVWEIFLIDGESQLNRADVELRSLCRRLVEVHSQMPVFQEVNGKRFSQTTSTRWRCLVVRW